MAPRVRVVVLNYNGGRLLTRCLERLLALEWPPDRLEIVVVDNASTDGSADPVAGLDGRVRVIRSERNLGFGAGNNLALQDLEEIDYVALLNNDALVEPGWLEPLVDALEEDQSLGAACPKILFVPRYCEIAISAPPFRPGGVDPRELGVKVSGVRVNARDRWTDTVFARSCYAVEHGPREEPHFHWTRPEGAVWIPLDGSEKAIVELRLAAERPKDVVLASGPHERTVEVGRRPAWHAIELGGEPFDVVQNAGGILIDRGYGGDRGFQERDIGQYDEPAEVFGWCGCSVLLRRRYLDEVGLFDPRLFLYYEDFDLSWRGRALGWRYRYVPESVVRHVHAASTVEHSPLFVYQVERSRLIVHLKNAPASYVARALSESARLTVRLAIRDIVRPLVRVERPYTGLVRLRLRALGSAARQVPDVLAERRTLRDRRRVNDAAILRWRTTAERSA